ncbi:MAG: DUF3035 domain-containing protein [Oxalobacteraceae bacterium]|nr:MAG: DUF3035 domain-containing protein [Oxalobacteraceae bacterium]
MRKQFRVVALAGVLGLGACSGDELTRTFGLTRDAPDEFQVTTRAPLSMPPDFSLRPPRPGASRPQELSGARVVTWNSSGASRVRPKVRVSSSPLQAPGVPQ